MADLIVQSGTGRIPIVNREGRKVVGILTHQDLLKARHKVRAGETQRTRYVGSHVNNTAASPPASKSQC